MRLGADKIADRRACQLPSDPFWGKVLGGFAAQRAGNETLKNQAAEAGAIRPRNGRATALPARRPEAWFLPEFQTRFAGRPQGLAIAALVQRNWDAVPMQELARVQLTRSRIDGVHVATSRPDVIVKAKAAEQIGLCPHELATNAAKYGALSVPSGDGWHRMAVRSGRRARTMLPPRASPTATARNWAGPKPTTRSASPISSATPSTPSTQAMPPSRPACANSCNRPARSGAAVRRSSTPPCEPIVIIQARCRTRCAAPHHSDPYGRRQAAAGDRGLSAPPVHLPEPAIPPTNNGSERALRPCVVFRKVTNCFRSEWAANLYADIRSVIETARRRAIGVLDAIRETLNGSPLVEMRALSTTSPKG